MGRLPAQLSDLASPAVNKRGETAGPFPATLPVARWTIYRYETAVDGTFRVLGSGDGTTVSFPSKERSREEMNG